MTLASTIAEFDPKELLDTQNAPSICSAEIKPPYEMFWLKVFLANTTGPLCCLSMKGP